MATLRLFVFSLMLRDVVGYRLLELSRGSQPLELQQRYFKDFSGGLDQHMRSLTHLLAAGRPEYVGGRVVHQL